MSKIAFTITIFLSILSIGIGFPISCPSAEDLYPCTCKRMAYGLHVVCADFSDSLSLVKAFKVLRDYKVQNVLLHNLMLKDVLPKDLFHGLEISELRVEKSNLTFQQPAFKGLDESLHVLNVAQHSVIKYSESFAIAKLSKLTELNIKKNPLGIVKDQWLNGKIPNVVSVRLDDDEITKVESKAFANLPRLQSISIAENRIQTVERSMLPMPAEHLKVIDLSGNEIKALPEDFFTDMPVLEEIVLSGNDLTTLSEATWGRVWTQLKVVVLFDNNIICDKSLSWITKVRWPGQVDGKCVAPSALVGKDLRDVYDTT